MSETPLKSKESYMPEADEEKLRRMISDVHSEEAAGFVLEKSRLSGAAWIEYAAGVENLARQDMTEPEFVEELRFLNFKAAPVLT